MGDPQFESHSFGYVVDLGVVCKTIWGRLRVWGDLMDLGEV